MIILLKDILRNLRESRGLAQSKIAELLDVSPAAYSTYEMGTRDVSSDKIVKLAKFYGVTTDYLYGIESDNEHNINVKEQMIIKKYRELDTHGKKIVDLVLDEEYERCTYVEEEDTITLPFSLLKASAGLGDYLFDENFEEIEVEDTTLANQADFVIEVDGDSMLPKFENGDKVFVKGQQNIDVGDFGIFIIDGCGYIKQVGNGELISLNSEYPNIELHDYNDVKCIGKVIGKVE